MSNTTAYASGTSAYVTDTKTGGGGRRGYAGAAGGCSTLSNSVSGKTTGGTLELTQTGRGGYGVALPAEPASPTSHSTTSARI